MKKLVLCLSALVLIFVFKGAQAQEAPDLTSQALFKGASNQKFIHRLTDRSYKTAWSGSTRQGSLDIISSFPIHGLYICWAQSPKAFSIQTVDDNKTGQTLHFEPSDIVHQYYPLEAQTHIRLHPDRDNGKFFEIEEIFILGKGDLPSWVQIWQPTYEDADLMLLFSHPDDEVLYFGGLLPYYVNERSLKVLPVLLTDAGAMRRSELLNSLWSLGVRHYPVLGSFPDLYSNDLEHAYRRNGKRKTNDFLTEIIRKHKPEVIVTHDIKGEYGHGVHSLCADLAINSIEYAKNPERHSASYQEYGLFDVQKLYLHLYEGKYGQAGIEMDWDLPLASFSGQTGFQMAVNAYSQFYLSQHRYDQFSVESRSSKYSSYKFGLYYTAVGPDLLKNDFMENIASDFVVKIKFLRRQNK